MIENLALGKYRQKDTWGLLVRLPSLQGELYTCERLYFISKIKWFLRLSSCLTHSVYTCLFNFMHWYTCTHMRTLSFVPKYLDSNSIQTISNFNKTQVK